MAENNYRLTYFNARGVAEPIRYIFAYAKVPYEDVRVVREDWGALKPTTPWGQVPVLEFQGKTLAQSAAIMRFLARKFNLTGSSELEAARCDELVDALGDLKAEWRKYILASEEDKKAELKKALLEVHVPKYYGKFDKIARNGKLVGESTTWVDLVVAVSLESMEKIDANVLNSYPNLKAVKDHVNNIPEIKAWREKRPVTDM